MLYDMLEICLLLLILLVLVSLALGRVGLPGDGWSDRCSIADAMAVHRCWCHDAVFRWLPLHRGKAGTLVLVKAGSGEPFVDQQYLLANRQLVRYLLAPQFPSSSWQSSR